MQKAEKPQKTAEIQGNFDFLIAQSVIPVSISAGKPRVYLADGNKSLLRLHCASI
jgi:hypothetical protein